MKLFYYLKIIRPKNLVIVALSQIFIYLVYLLPERAAVSMELEGHLWVLFVIDTILIAAGGYIVNDIYDQNADHLNKPEKRFVGKDGISVSSGWWYYGICTIMGFVLAGYIAFSIEKVLLLSIYPFAVALLFLYSRYFKRMPLLGNFVVSLFCAFVPAIIWYAEYDMVNSLRMHDAAKYEVVVNVFIAYIVFAFLSTLVREIIKDFEDIEGDEKSYYQTLPIKFGHRKAKVVALFFCTLLLISYSLWLDGYTFDQLLVVGGIVFLGLILPTVFILRSIYYANTQKDYAIISKRLKYLMISSLFIFLCIPFILTTI